MPADVSVHYVTIFVTEMITSPTVSVYTSVRVYDIVNACGRALDTVALGFTEQDPSNITGNIEDLWEKDWELWLSARQSEWCNCIVDPTQIQPVKPIWLRTTPTGMGEAAWPASTRTTLACFSSPTPLRLSLFSKWFFLPFSSHGTSLQRISFSSSLAGLVVVITILFSALTCRFSKFTHPPYLEDILEQPTSSTSTGLSAVCTTPYCVCAIQMFPPHAHLQIKRFFFS